MHHISGSLARARAVGAPVPIGVGIVGYGASGRNLHAVLLAASPAFEVVAIADPATIDAADRLPQARVVRTLDALLADPRVELVVVATPNASHARLAARALRAGRHVIVDKPFVPRVREADRLIDIAARQGRVLSVFHNRRWDDDYRTVAKVIGDGRLGAIHRYLARFEFLVPDPIPVGDWRRQGGPGSGLLYDVGSHMIDQAVQALGPPDVVTARLHARPGRPDHAFTLVLEMAGIEAVLLASERTVLPGPTFEVHGREGSLVVDGGRDGQEARLMSGRVTPRPDERAAPARLRRSGASGTERVPRVMGDYASYYRQLARAIRRGEAPPVTADAARGVIAIIEAAQRSARTGRAIRV